MVGLAATTVLQLVDPTSLLELPGLVRAPTAFLVVMLLGAGILWRYDALVERSIEAAIDRPLSSLGYGVAAHLTIAFFGAYSASQLGQLTVSGRSLAGIGLLGGLFVFGLVAALGFTVVGTAATQVGWERHRWYGLVVGATLAGLAALVDLRVGGLVWIVVVSTGIGGRVRLWLHAAEGAESA